MQGGPSLPAAPQSIPGLPENAEFFQFAGWEGLDTKPPRPGVGDDKCAWLDNIMPLGPNNMRAVPDCDANPFYTAPGNLTIIHFDFFGLQPLGVNTGPYAAVFLSDGSAVAIRLQNAAVTTIAPPGTFAPPAGTSIATRQYGTQYLLIATVQSLNGYWIWDGANLYTSGTVGPQVNITSGGNNYTSLPTIAIVGGSGGGATFVPTIVNGAVSTIAVLTPGSGWIGADATQALLTFTGGGSGTTAYGVAGIANNAITGVTIINGGHGFTSIPNIGVVDGTGVGAQIIVTAISGGSITGVRVVDCGNNYTSPTIAAGGPGAGALFAPIIQSGVINSVVMTHVGSLYESQPQVVFISPTGSGASGIAVLSQGTIVGVDFGLGLGAGFSGAGYTGSVLVAFQGGGGPASALVELMPFGVQGNAIEVYQSRAWISTTTNVVKVFFTAPGSVTNFGTPAGGGVFPATESSLRYQFTNLIASNGFLYLIGDSNVNYVSGVQTTGSPATTTFSNLNIDPQIGSPWRDSVQVFSRAIIMANPFGIHAIYGGAVQKISTPLDGVFNTGVITNVLNGPSSAVATLFGVHVYLFLMPILDPITNVNRNILFMWDGKRWWTAGQHAGHPNQVNLTKIATQEWGSDINAWGTDGKSLYQLFTTPSIFTKKTLRSKLWMRPGINVQKKAMQMYAFWLSTQASTLNFTVDTETGASPITQGVFTATSGINQARSNAGDSLGYSMGFTMTSVGADFTVIDLMLMAMDRRLKV